MEIYAAGRIVDVLVAQALAARVLRGACSVTWAGQRCALAWGCLPPCSELSVRFTGGLPGARACPARVSVVAGWFWVAPAAGRFRRVTVDHADGRERCRVRCAPVLSTRPTDHGAY